MSTSMKMLWRRIGASTLVRRFASRAGPNQPRYQAGSPLEQEVMSTALPSRLEQLRHRLFVLARVERQLRANGLRMANGMNTVSTPHEAGLLLNEALKRINAERLVLLAEQEVICTELNTKEN